MHAERWVNGRAKRLSASLSSTVCSTIGPTTDCQPRFLRVSSEAEGAPSIDLQIRQRLHTRLRNTLKRDPLPRGTHAILHGSYASGTVTAFSDVDVVLILDESVADSELALLGASCRGLLRVLYSAAPLAHHGLNVIFRGELARYDQSVLPIAALESGLSLGETPFEIEVHWDPKLSQLGARARLERQLLASRRNFALQSRLLYRRQSALSVLLLLPSLLVEAISGAYPYKRESFELAKPYFQPEEWLAIELASKLRQSWHLPARLKNIAEVVNSPASILSPDAGRKVVAALSWQRQRSLTTNLAKPAEKFIGRCEELLHACR